MNVLSAPELKNPRRVLLRRPASIPFYHIFRTIRPYTMVDYDGQMQMRDLILEVDKQGIVGDLVETGCWKGGCAAFMAYVSKHNGSNRYDALARKTWMFDSFEGLPAPTEKDVGMLEKGITEGHIAAGERYAHEITRQLGVEQNTKIIKGWFKDTLHKAQIRDIAILRMDGDFYSSTMETLDALYDSVMPGGYIVIDDYNFEGCRQALYDFFSKRRIAPLLVKGNKYERTYFRKT